MSYGKTLISDLEAEGVVFSSDPVSQPAPLPQPISQPPSFSQPHPISQQISQPHPITQQPIAQQPIAQQISQPIMRPSTRKSILQEMDYTLLRVIFIIGTWVAVWMRLGLVKNNMGFTIFVSFPLGILYLYSAEQLDQLDNINDVSTSLSMLFSLSIFLALFSSRLPTTNENKDLIVRISCVNILLMVASFRIIDIQNDVFNLVVLLTLYALSLIVEL
jgi:hypothetical protein